MWERYSLQPVPCLNVQYLAWMCRDLKRAKKMYNCSTSKEIVKLKRMVNEQPISVEHESEIKSLYPNFVFKERDRLSWGVICF